MPSSEQAKPNTNLGSQASEYLAGNFGSLQVQGPKGYKPSCDNASVKGAESEVTPCEIVSTLNLTKCGEHNFFHISYLHLCITQKTSVALSVLPDKIYNYYLYLLFPGRKNCRKG